MKKKINRIAELIQGVNQSRVQLDENQVFYDQTLFEHDLSNMYAYSTVSMKQSVEEDIYLNEGDIVISSTIQNATLIGKSDKKRVLTINFTKVKLSEEIDKAYFIYLYNLNREVQRQKERETQTMGHVQRMTLKSMGSIEIPIVSMEKQRNIGNAFMMMSKIKNDAKHYIDLIDKLTYSILEEIMEVNLNDKESN